MSETFPPSPLDYPLSQASNPDSVLSSTRPVLQRTTRRVKFENGQSQWHRVDQGADHSSDSTVPCKTGPVGPRLQWLQGQEPQECGVERDRPGAAVEQVRATAEDEVPDRTVPQRVQEGGDWRRHEQVVRVRRLGLSRASAISRC